MNFYACLDCGSERVGATSLKCYDCGSTNTLPKSSYDKYQALLYTVNNTSNKSSKPKPIVKKEDKMDIQKYARQQNAECGGKTDFDMVVGDGVYATRSWNRDRYGRLKSPQRSHMWTPGENVASNGHGFYAYTDKPTWDADVHGIIRAFGKVTYGSRGLIAEKAEIVAIYEKPVNYHTRVKRASARLYNHLGGDTGTKAMTFMAILCVLGVFMFVGLSPVALLAATILLKVLGWLGVLVGASLVYFAACGLASTARERRDILDGTAYSLKEIYPDVKFYKSKSKMLKDFGLPNNYKEGIPTPDTEDFWKL